MSKYHKINGIYKREDGTGKFIKGDFSKEEFALLQHIPWRWTEKIDGTNIRVNWCAETGKVTFKGRTDKAQIPEHLFEYLRDKFDPYRFEKYETDITLYGEGMGHKIQSGGPKYFPHATKTVEFCLFDVRIGKWWLRKNDVVDIAEEFNIPNVGEYQPKTLRNMLNDFEDGRKLRSFFNPEIEPEGVIGIPICELYDRAHERVIVKLKYKDFK